MAVPNFKTNIRFFTGVPFSLSYEHVRYFDNKSQQTSYFNRQTVLHTEPEGKIVKGESQKIRVSCDIDKLYNSNYMEFKNHDGKTFYCFVTELEHIQNGVTEVSFIIDVFQTWLFDVTMKQSFVEREHRPLWNSDGTPVVNTLNEDVAYGSEYDTVKDYHLHPSRYRYIVMVCNKEVAYLRSEGDLQVITPQAYLGGPTQMITYFVPIKVDDGKAPDTLDGDLTLNLYRIIDAFSLNEKNVKTLVSLYPSDFIGLKAPTGDINNPSTPSGCQKVFIEDSEGRRYACYRPMETVSFEETAVAISNKYLGTRSTTESKLLMYPYTIFEMTTFQGEMLTFKGEYLAGQGIGINVKGSVSTANKVAYSLLNYNNTGDNSSLAYQNSVINVEPNGMAIITDYSTEMMQAERNSLNARKNNAIIEGVSTGVSGTLNGVANWFNPVGAGASVLDGVQRGAVHTVKEMNSLIAKMEDAKNIPPSVKNMGANYQFDFGNGFTGIRVLVKQLKPEYQKKLEDYFKMYGYKINEVKLPNRHTRQSWNFVKTVGCNIVGNMNQKDLISFKRIFDDGVTLWHTDNMMDYSQGNGVL